MPMTRREFVKAQAAGIAAAAAGLPVFTSVSYTHLTLPTICSV